VRTTALPKFIRDLLGSCPSAGSGVHNWLYRVARLLHPYYEEKQELLLLLKAASAGCGRHIPNAEILDAIRNSESHAWRPGQQRPEGEERRAAWPARDFQLIHKLALGGPDLKSLASASPVIFNGPARASEEIVDLLFPEESLLCCGTSARCFDTRRRELWRGCLPEMALIVPSPMSARTGRTQDGRVSARSLANTGPRKFLVVEFDFKAVGVDGGATPDSALLRSMADVGRSVTDICAALHDHLGNYAPLTLVVHSGGKSLHGWYHAEGQPESKLRKFMRYAVSIGADPATWTPCQFVRMPDGTRENGQRQRVHFFNPGVLP
jgi:hypothetical protein